MQSSQSKTWIILVVVLIALIILGFAGYKYYDWSKKQSKVPEDVVLTSELPEDNKFGWLGAGEDDFDFKFITEAKGAWMRPHPGPAVWDMMQNDENKDIDFEKMDSLVKSAQKYGVNLMITVWPFAEWDQKNRSDLASCAVSPEDDFLAKNDKKGRPAYLPEHRCLPSNWDKYNQWLEKVVERYDADGQNDMEGLNYPVKYWEILNEPDLTWKNAKEADRLTFFKQGPAEYGQLLKQSYETIKKADSKAQVLIAGAAGGDEDFLSFYNTLFEGMPEAKNYFDIGNVHCISNDRQTHDFNVAGYKKMLEKYGIAQKQIWVTEAEAMYGGSFQENVASTTTSVKNAILAGAEKIFFTRYNFADDRTDMSQKSEDKEQDLQKSQEAFRNIISAY